MHTGLVGSRRRGLLVTADDKSISIKHNCAVTLLHEGIFLVAMLDGRKDQLDGAAGWANTRSSVAGGRAALASRMAACLALSAATST